MIDLITTALFSVVILFAPGLVVSFAIFPKMEITTIERISISFGLSIAVVPLLLFYLNAFFTMPITTINATIVAFGVIVLAGIYWYFHRKRTH